MCGWVTFTACVCEERCTGGDFQQVCVCRKGVRVWVCVEKECRCVGDERSVMVGDIQQVGVGRCIEKYVCVCVFIVWWVCGCVCGLSLIHI